MKPPYFRMSLPSDIPFIGDRMRKADEAEVRANGNNPYKSLLGGYMKSAYPLTLIGSSGNPAAMFGVLPQTDNSGAIWLLGTDEIKTLATFFCRSAKAYIGLQLRYYTKLWNMVHADNYLHRRWLKWAGFEFGPEIIVNNEPFIYFEKGSHHV